jgi:hypothetical protein
VRNEAFAARWLISNQLEPMAVSKLGASMVAMTSNFAIYRSLRRAVPCGKTAGPKSMGMKKGFMTTPLR